MPGGAGAEVPPAQSQERQTYSNPRYIISGNGTYVYFIFLLSVPVFLVVGVELRPYQSDQCPRRVWRDEERLLRVKR